MTASQTTDPTLVAAYRDTRVVVLGAAGFVGRWVARALSNHGADVYLVVRDLTRASSVFARYGAAGHMLEVDLSKAESVERLVRDVRPAVVFNLSGYGVDPLERDQATAFEINAHLLEIVCEALQATPRPAWPGLDIVHVGSALEYGDVGGILSEDTPPRPTTVYGQSKLAGTEVVAAACARLGLKGVTARLFTVYGPGEHAGRLLPSLLEAASTGSTLSLTSGRQLRDFTYVEEVAEALLRLGLASPKPGEIVNLATGRLTSVRAFAEVAADVLQIPADKLAFGAIPTRVEEMEHAEVAVDRLRQLVGRVPSESIRDGIRQTAAFMRSTSTPD